MGFRELRPFKFTIPLTAVLLGAGEKTKSELPFLHQRISVVLREKIEGKSKAKQNISRQPVL